VSLAANLALLGFFKYGGFALENTQALLAALGVIYAPPRWDVVLPVGISFYTFASLSYTIDVYRREIEAETPLLDYALFVAFFPHLVAGPIVRARALLPQIAAPREASAQQVGWGLTLVVIGLFCKSVLADAILAPVADGVFNAPTHHPGIGAIAGIFGFAGQIYFDFGGYSLCAIGLALSFGYAFPDNFRFPYAARGLSDFWRRWHISLSTWLRDYLYIPLGGNRGGEGRTNRNLMLTMLIGGLWHGASWMFVAWGLLHGFYLVAERWLRHRRPGWFRGGWNDIVLTLTTFLLVCLAWIPFRARSIPNAVDVLAAPFRGGMGSTQEWLTLGVVAASVAWQWRMRDTTLEAVASRSPSFVRAAAAGLCMIGVFLASGGDDRAFIYFQF
jgi:D-alanyl-lipoteichoic acid acyltransferase DltB (MBOAT superfamily)